MFLSGLKFVVWWSAIGQGLLLRLFEVVILLHEHWLPTWPIIFQFKGLI
jgi:hypothetical protein